MSGSEQAPGHGPEADEDPHLDTSRRVLWELMGPPEERGLRVEYWDGGSDPPACAPATLRLRWPGALRRMLLPPTDLSVGEAYVRGDVDFDGDVEAAVRAGWERLEALDGPLARARLLRLLRRLPQRPARPAEGSRGPNGSRGSRRPARPLDRRERDARAVRAHYDVGNDFFRLFLDEAMQYSCAYFPRADTGLDEAQEAKLDLICRKLRLEPGERFLDVGCGWGGLVLHAAREYGVEAVGITLSRPQAERARDEAARQGLSERVRIEVLDYRDLPRERPFDKAASVGMIEHVGLGRYPAYFGSVRDVLRPGGLFLNHGIVHLRRGHAGRDRLRLRLERRRSFIHRHIFPSSDLVPLGRTLTAAERAGLEVRDVESLREHYARTLRHWVERLETRWAEALEAVGEPTARAWRFYMGASAHLFASGFVGIAQSLLARPAPDGTVTLPPTRNDLYVDPR